MSANAFAGAIRPADDVMDVIEWPPNGKLSRNAKCAQLFPRYGRGMDQSHLRSLVTSNPDN
jgi:hypothetical protein